MRSVFAGGGAGADSGPRFQVTLVKGSMVRIFDSFKSTQDLYVQLIRAYADGRKEPFGRTATCVSGNLAPKWDEERFEFNQHGGQSLILRVFCEHFWRQDHLCGEAEVRFDSLPGGGQPARWQLNLQKKGEMKGTLSVDFLPCRWQRARSELPALCSGKDVKADLERLLHRPEELEERVRIQFQRLAGPHGRNGELALRPEDCDSVREFFGEKLGVGGDVFGEISQMFWRFEVAGDGRLYEDEAARMLLCMLRQYRDALKGSDHDEAEQLDIKTQDASEAFDIIRELGRGGQGIANLAKNKATGQEVVLKMYAKANHKQAVEETSQEFKLLLELKHPKIARVFEIFQDWSNVYIVQEPYFGGDLTTAVANAYKAGEKPDERWVSDVMLQVCSGVQFLHKKGVIHSDLKEPNVMVANNSDWRKPQVIVIDFGLANKFSAKTGVGGTPGYMPPEVWDWGLWTPRGDVFSIGVIMFTLRTGKGPFNHDGRRSVSEVKAATRESEAVMTLGSPEMKALVGSMLHKQFLNRPQLGELMLNPWFNTSGTDQELDMKALKDLTQRHERNDLYRALLTDVAARQNMAQLSDLNEMFMKLDQDNDGSISAEELREGLRAIMKTDEIERLIAVLGVNAGGGVTYDEFLGELLAAKVPEENSMLHRVFEEADTQRLGYLTMAELQELAKRPAIVKIIGSEEAALARMRAMDQDGSGRVTFEEFKRAAQGFVSASMRPNLSFTRYTKGQAVQYWSASFSRWVSGVVTDVDKVRGVAIDCKPGQWLTGSQLEGQLRPAEATPGGDLDGRNSYSEGQAVVMWSMTYSTWIPCNVTEVEPGSGAVIVDQKPGYWLRGNELATRLKPADAMRPSTSDARIAAQAGVGRQLLAAATGLR